MADKCDEWVDRAIEFTIEAMEKDAVEWPAARAGLAKMARGLKGCPPDHPALDRIRRFIAARDSLLALKGRVRH
jgi:hypothetical protein